MKKIAGDRQVRLRTIAGLTTVLGGGVVLFLGWWGMAGKACLDCQLPYIVSGGLAGTSLIVFGSTLLILAGLRAERIKAEARTQELIQVMGRLGTALTAGESAEGLVLAGKSTYHRPECRLVKDKELEKISVQVASASGLTACRVCSPEVLDEDKAEAKDKDKAEAASSSDAGKKAPRSTSRRAQKKG